MSGELRVCRKCLLRERPGEEYFRKLEQYIKKLDEEDRVSQEIYEKRLGICGECEFLTEGMCRLCGCFVELRTSLRVRKCPALPAKWQTALDGKREDPALQRTAEGSLRKLVADDELKRDGSG